ncbi:MAG: hypothetical protein ABI583_13120, partial [Betaproteobacteria bacterium]
MKVALGILLTLMSIAASAQQSAKVITLPANSKAGEVRGTLRDGHRLSSLRWAEQSNVACFPGTRFEMFTGKHVFYRITLPAASAITITVTPANKAPVSLYALRQGMNDQSVPPDIKSAISCEASYPIYANLGGGRTVANQDDGTRKVEYISIRSPYSILIGTLHRP